MVLRQIIIVDYVSAIVWLRATKLHFQQYYKERKMSWPYFELDSNSLTLKLSNSNNLICKQLQALRIQIISIITNASVRDFVLCINKCFIKYIREFNQVITVVLHGIIYLLNYSRENISWNYQQNLFSSKASPIYY